MEVIRRSQLKCGKRVLTGSGPYPRGMVVDAADVRFSVLGPVRAWRDGHEVALGSPQQCAVLGLLLLGRGRPIGLEALVDQVWGDAAPVAARATVRTYLSRLRRALP